MPNKSLVINMLPPTNVVAVRQCFQLCLCVCPQGWHPHLTITLDAIGQLKVIWGLPPTALTIQGPLLPPSHQTTNPPRDMFKLVHCASRTVGKRTVGIRLKCLLLF